MVLDLGIDCSRTIVECDANQCWKLHSTFALQVPGLDELFKAPVISFFRVLREAASG